MGAQTGGGGRELCPFGHRVQTAISVHLSSLVSSVHTCASQICFAFIPLAENKFQDALGREHCIAAVCCPVPLCVQCDLRSPLCVEC